MANFTIINGAVIPSVSLRAIDRVISSNASNNSTSSAITSASSFAKLLLTKNSAEEVTDFINAIPTSAINAPSGVPGLDSSGNFQATIVLMSDTTANLADVVGPAHSLAVNTTTGKLILFDGVTAGGRVIG